MKKSLYVKFRDGEYRSYGPFSEINVNDTNEHFMIFVGDNKRRIWISKHDAIFIDVYHVNE